MRRLDYALRRVIPSTAIVSRSIVFRPILGFADAIARAGLRLFGRHRLPPLRYIVRTGVGNRIFFPHFAYLTLSADIWLYFFSRGLADLNSTIVDIGSGAGKSAVALREFRYNGTSFRGQYHGFDIDAEMIRWCQANFPPDHFQFTGLDMASTVYNPNGTPGHRPRLDRDDGSVDLVFSQSLFSHLLEDDIRHYLAESFRIVRPGGAVMMTFFCLDDMRDLGLLGGRWTFRHAMGAAYVESVRYPESAVAYEREWMIETARACGFSEVRVILAQYQSTLECIG